MPEQTVRNGLQTDPSPERLNGGAFRLLNVIPVSAEAVMVRPPVNLVAHYYTQQLGRNIVVDVLPQDIGEGVLVSCVTTTNDTGNAQQSVTALGVFRPAKIASEYEGVAGIDLGQSIFAILI